MEKLTRNGISIVLWKNVKNSRDSSPKNNKREAFGTFRYANAHFFSAVISRRLINDDVKYELFMHYNVVLILIFVEIDIDQIMRGGVDITRIK